MKERPIIFSTDMVRAILDGRKTQTRRVVKPPKNTNLLSGDNIYWDDDNEPPGGDGTYRGCAVLECDDMGGTPEYLSCPYGQPGDLLWVRETWWKPPYITRKMEQEGADTWPSHGYHADLNENDIEQFREWGWSKKPSIHMPKAAARLWLEVTDIRVEQVQEISEEDAKAEGVASSIAGEPAMPYYTGPFTRLWNKINAKRGYSYESHPWVWVVSFKRYEK